MDTSIMVTLLREHIQQVLSGLDDATEDNILEKFDLLGVETVDDIRYVQEDDLLCVLKPIQVRKLLSRSKLRGQQLTAAAEQSADVESKPSLMDLQSVTGQQLTTVAEQSADVECKPSLMDLQSVTEGNDNGKYSIIDSSWIRGFNGTTSNSGDDAEYMAEWRQGEKPWPCFEAAVIDVAEKECVLLKKMSELISSDNKEENIPEKRKSCPKRRLAESISHSEDEEESELCISSQVLRDKVNRLMSEINKTASTQKTSVDLKKENMSLKSENENLKSKILEELPAVLTCLKELIGQLKESSSTPKLADVGDVASTSIQTLLRKKELHPGSGVFVTLSQYVAMESCNSATTFVRTALIALFDAPTLLKSNFRGGASKRASLDEERKEQLDPKIISALIDATKEKFPGTRIGTIGEAVNKRIAELKFRSKKREAESKPVVPN